MAALLYRLGAFSARHRVAFLVGWLTVLVWLAAGAIGGMASISGNTGQAGEFFKIPGAESSVAMETLRREFPQVLAQSEAETLHLVLQAPTGRITTEANIGVVLDIVARAATVDSVVSVANPLDPQRPYVSPDQTTAVVTLTLDGVTEANAGQVEAAVADLAAQARQRGLLAEVGGDIRNEEIAIFGPLEAVGAGVAFLVLVIALGSLVAAGMNMLTALVGVGTGVLGAFAYGALVEPIGSMTPALAVMLGLALGIDYGLFIISRFRAELREGRLVVDAAGRAVATAGSSVVVAGCTVITAVAALGVIGIPPITEIGLAAAFAVGVDVLVALTLIPAVLGLVGRRAVTRRERAGTSRRDTRRPRLRLLERWGGAVVRFRVTSLVTGVAILGVAALPAIDLRTALTIPGGSDPTSSQRAAYEMVIDRFGGVQSPLLVLVEGTRVAPRLPAVTAALQELPGATYVVPGETSRAGDVAFLTVIPAGGPTDQSTKDLVASIRGIADATAGVHLSVTGETAISIDSDAQLREALGIYLAIIVGVCLLLLVVLFRSLLVPLVAAAGFLLSLGAALGATVAIWQWGWGAGLPADVGNPVMSFLPILVTGILFGLAMDYQVFLVSRMHEAHTRGLSPREAIVDGFVRSGPVVAAAAAIMAFVFGGFGGSPTMSLASIALALAIGVVADAFIVRMIIVPAALALLGRGAWWLPRWLDRILPHLDAEGHTAPSTTAPRVSKGPLLDARR